LHDAEIPENTHQTQSVDNNGYQAFIWTRVSGMRNLNKLIPPNSGLVLEYAYGINNAGQIVGEAYSNGGSYRLHAFLLTPVK
jgi:probable HAF family extracellular repeat protein